MIIRTEDKEDINGVYSVNEKAFERDAEAKLVDSLRANVDSAFSLVAQESGKVLGHIMFSPMSTETQSNVKIFGLAPLAVDPEYQNSGIGSLLVKAGLEECRKQNISAIFVLGHANYYPRFGFKPSNTFGIKSEYDVAPEVFMAIELIPGALSNVKGLVKYCSEFSSV